jgi:hypothetical protein
MYWEAFDNFGFGPHRAEDGALVLSLPMGDRKLAGIAATDIGRTALGILKRGDQFIGKTVGIAGEHLTGEEFAAAFSDFYGEPVAYRPLDFDEFRAQNIPAAGEVGNMFQFYYRAKAESRAPATPPWSAPSTRSYRHSGRGCGTTTPSPLNSLPVSADPSGRESAVRFGSCKAGEDTRELPADGGHVTCRAASDACRRQATKETPCEVPSPSPWHPWRWRHRSSAAAKTHRRSAAR